MKLNRFLPAVLVCYITWLGFLAIHELGHVIGAWVTGGRVIDVSIPLFGFSQTIGHPNPRELVVVWAGPVVGTIAPFLLLLIWRAARRRVPDLLLFFAGFCAIANGAYIGVGWIWRAGHAGDMLRLGTPVWVMALFGVTAIVLGLTLWHRTRSLSTRAKP